MRIVMPQGKIQKAKKVKKYFKRFLCGLVIIKTNNLVVIGTAKGQNTPLKIKVIFLTNFFEEVNVKNRLFF
jgi:hypothetical protein